jgi:2-hydroxy-6-oxonona-2,4-dienedioate hydrolase
MALSYWNSMLGGRVGYWDVDGVSTRVLEAGNPGDKLILCVHGSGGHAENFVTNLVPLSAAGHVVAPDLLGHGLNTRPPNASYTMRGVLDHLKRVMDLAGGDAQISLLGLSLGGVLAAHLARECRDRVDKFVMICPSGISPGALDHEAIDEGASRMRDGTKVALESPTLENCRRRVENLVSDPTRIPEEMVWLRQYMYTRPGSETMLSVLQDNVDHIDEYIVGDEVLHDIDARGLIVWGRHNSTPVSVAERAAKELKNGEIVVFEDSGHWPHYEEQDAFHAKVLEFLRS